MEKSLLRIMSDWVLYMKGKKGFQRTKKDLKIKIKQKLTE